jgi:hypothetical protein
MTICKRVSQEDGPVSFLDPCTLASGICLGMLLSPLICGIPNLFRPQKECPACHAPFPRVRLWENGRHLKWGIWTCHQCSSQVGCNGIMPPRPT